MIVPVTGLAFEEQAAPPASAPSRMDIALFVGCIGRRSGPIPSALRDWLTQQGWAVPAYGRLPLDDLLDVPVPIDDWSLFDALFTWEQRSPDMPSAGSTYLGAAVRSFFAEGGRRCYVVRTAVPAPSGWSRAGRLTLVSSLIPGYPGAFAASPVDKASWRGAAHLFGLPDVSFLCLPDLADLVAADAPAIGPAEQPPPLLEAFVECSSNAAPALIETEPPAVGAPRCDEVGYGAWVRALSVLARACEAHAREVQVVAAIPLPVPGTPAEADLPAFLAGGMDAPLGLVPNEQMIGLASPCIQLVYPWVRTSGSAALPERVESPDGVLLGMLARNALEHGTFISIAGTPPADVYQLVPLLPRRQMLVPRRDTMAANAGLHSLVQRVSLLGPAPNGPALLSDVTTDLDEWYRQGSINRLLAVIAREARTIGEGLVFEPSGERLWASITQQMQRLFLALLDLGALRGSSPEEAFSVRCDRTTMSRNDLDNGRVIVEVNFAPAAPIEGISIVLALSTGGQVALTATGGMAA